MKYQGQEALGLIETLGMVPAIYGADSMLKAANVSFISYENVGSTLVTIIVVGDVAAVKASVEAGALAATSAGKLTAKNIMPRPVKGVGDVVSVHAFTAEEDEAEPTKKALGLLETFGVVYLLEAADAMIKAAEVELIGYENVASGYVSVLVQGDVAACEAAVAAGRKAVQAMQTEVYSAVVIPSPHPDLGKMIQRYRLDKLLA